jgi:hypothetical protein
MKNCFIRLLFLLSVLNTVAQSSTEEVLTNASVINLHNKGLASSIIISKIKASKTNFIVPTDTLIKYKELKIPDDIVSAMVEASGNQEEIIIPNDPTSRHQSGIYLCNSVDGKTEMKVIDPTSSSSSDMKTSGMSVKYKQHIDGKTSKNRVKNMRPVFYFYFGKASSLNQSGAYFSNSSNPSEFLLVKFKIKSKKREYTTGKMGMGGMKSGIADKDKIEFDYEKIKEGIYKITPKKDLKLGEYGFMASSTGASMFVISSGGKVNDFGIDK